MDKYAIPAPRSMRKREAWEEYLMWKGCLVAIQDAGIIEHHPLRYQRDDTVPKPGDHLSISEGDRLPGEGDRNRTKISERSQQTTEITYNLVIPLGCQTKQLTPSRIYKSGFLPAQCGSGGWHIIPYTERPRTLFLLRVSTGRTHRCFSPSPSSTPLPP